MNEKNFAVKKIACLCMTAFLMASNFSVFAAAPNSTVSQSQTTSLPETIYVNSYSGQDRSLLFDNHWKFHLGEANGAQEATFDDSAWRDVQLPHDYSIEQPYSQNAEAESAYLPGGIGWYRKSFLLSPDWRDKVISIDFGGVYMNATIYINGHKLGTHPYGYTPFSFVLPTEYLHFDKENVVAVHVNHQTPSSRWYSGSGIYRSVHLTVTDRVHVARYGTSVVTPKENTGDVEITTKIQNDSTQASEIVLKHSITEKGKTDVLANVQSTSFSIPSNQSKEIKSNLHLETFKKWDIGEGNLYTIKTEVIQNETVLDTYETDFGFRWYEFDRDNGFRLNGKYHKLKGVSMHHDQGPLGSEAWRRAIERQVEILQDMGVNAIRVTHNPAADELIEIANEKGMLIIDEAFDTWTSIKNYNTQDYSKWFEKKIEQDNNIVGGKPGEMTWAEFDLTAMVMRDKNAPSVILYSLGNELLEITTNNTSKYQEFAAKLSAWVKKADPTRPVTFGDNKLKANDQRSLKMAEEIHKAGGIIGFNYASKAQMDRYRNYNWKMYGSETASAINSRGVYDRKSSQQDKNSDRLLTSYDKSKVGWGALASESWWDTITVGYNAGTFVWTGFDYLGEPTPWNNTGSGVAGGVWPAPKHSYFGIVDIAGFPKDSYYLYQSQWNEKKNTLHVLPTWNQEEILIDEKGEVEVVVYSDAPYIKLFLNDELIGTAKAEKKQAGQYTYQQYTSGTDAFVKKQEHESLYATFNVKYEKGTLRAEAWTAENGQKIENTDGRSVVTTTSIPASLKATADRKEILADGRDLSYITIDVEDAHGNFVNGAEPQIDVSITGQGKILALENGMHNDHTPYTSLSRKAMKGKLLVIVQSTDDAGEFTVTASSPTLKSTSVTVKTKPVKQSTGENRIVSYEMARNLYVLKGNVPQLPKEVSLTYANGTTQVQPITWDTIDPSLYEKTGTFSVNGIIQNVNLSTKVNVTMMEGVSALQNYSTAIMIGSKPNLPSTRPAIQADGTILNAEFPVTWHLDGMTFQEEKVYEVKGTSNVFGKQMSVTAWVRAGAGSIVQGDNLAPAAPGLYLNDNHKENAEALRPLVDGNKNSDVWKGKGTIYFRYDTAQNLYKTVITRKENTERVEPKISWSGTGESWTELTPTVSSEQNTDTYTLSQLVPAVWVKLEFPSEVTLTEIELVMGAPSFTMNQSAELSKIVLDGIEVDKASMKAHDYPTQALAVYETEITSDANASYTVLPAHENIVRILTKSEDQSNQAVYTIRLGQSTTGTISPDDNSRDYKGNLTATAPSNAKTSENEGGAEFAIDKKEHTIWHTNWGGGTGPENLVDKPEERYIELQLEEVQLLDGLRYLPRKDVSNGRVTQYEVKVSTNAKDWQTVSTGHWEDNGEWKIAPFTQPIQAKQVRLYGHTTEGTTQNKFMSAAEIRLQEPAQAKPTVDLSKATVTLEPSFDYTGYPIEPRPVVMLEGKTLRYGVDYRMEYENNIEPGTATMKIVGMIGYTGIIEKTFTINAVDVKVESYEPVVVTTQAGEDPSGKLPSVVKATMNVGPVRELPVVWDKIQPEQYADVGVFTIMGTVEGQTLKPQAKIQVIGALAAQNISMAILNGTQPNLPQTVTVYFTDETSGDYPVQWNLEGIDFTAGQIVKVPGVVTVGAHTLPTSASVRVVDAAQLEKTLISQQVEASTLPLAVSFYSSPSDTAANINDGLISFDNTDGKKVWSDWERGKFHENPWVGIVLGTQDEPQEKIVDKISIGFIAEAGETALKVPQDFTVQYYVGEVLDYNTSSVDSGQTWEHMSNPANWRDVENIKKGTMPSDEDYRHMVDAEFTPVTTKAIRVVMQPKANQWVGVDELQVYGAEQQSHQDFTVSSIQIDGKDRLAEFDENKTLTISTQAEKLALFENKLPDIQATATNNAAVSVISSIQFNGKAIITFVPENGDISKKEIYTIQYISNEPAVHKIMSNVPHLKVSHEKAAQGETITLSFEQGYHLKENTLKVVSNGAEIVVDSSTLSFEMPDADVTISAQTEPIVYEIRYDLQGGRLEQQNPLSYTVETPTFTLYSPIRDGFMFEGWVTQSNQNPVKEVSISIGSIGNLHFTAVWKQVSPVTPTPQPEKPAETPQVPPTTPTAPPTVPPVAGGAAVTKPSSNQTSTKPKRQVPVTGDPVSSVANVAALSGVLLFGMCFMKNRRKK